MKYLSVKDTAKKWGISGTMVRRYCNNGCIPNAVQTENGWKIPATAKKPNSTESAIPKKKELPALAKKLIRQKTKKNYHGLYDYVQINLTYSSNRMASNRLTRDQVELIFKKGKVSNMFEPVKISDLIETMNHCICIDYILDHLSDPLSPQYVKHIHYLLTYGTVDSRLSKVLPGEFRSPSSSREESFISPVSSIASSLKALTTDYETCNQKDIQTILTFHVKLERIFPFEDYNGRVGRLIMLKECLRHNVMPFILDDKRRSRYLDGLRSWDDTPDPLITVVKEAQERFAHQIDQHEWLEHGRTFLPSDYWENE